MKNLKLMALTIATGFVFATGMQANAEVGYIDYQKVLTSYPAAQQAAKEIDAKGLELQQFMIDKEKQYKALDTPLKKQNFEAQTRQELIAKEDALIKLRQAKESHILNQVQTAAKAVMVTQKLDAVLSNQVIFVGGVDVTDAVIQKLKEMK
ncbi:OmpH family outer membrane protein [bacterium]|nr:OmpH family outer membrane protein [bacterium]